MDFSVSRQLFFFHYIVLPLRHILYGWAFLNDMTFPNDTVTEQRLQWQPKQWSQSRKAIKWSQNKPWKLCSKEMCALIYHRLPGAPAWNSLKKVPSLRLRVITLFIIYFMANLSLQIAEIQSNRTSISSGLRYLKQQKKARKPMQHKYYKYHKCSSIQNPILKYKVEPPI